MLNIIQQWIRSYIGIKPKGVISYLRMRNSYLLAIIFSHGIIPCFAFCMLHSSRGRMLTLYRCLMKVAFIWVVIPNRWAPRWSLAARSLYACSYFPGASFLWHPHPESVDMDSGRASAMALTCSDAVAASLSLGQSLWLPLLEGRMQSWEFLCT